MKRKHLIGWPFFLALAGTVTFTASLAAAGPAGGAGPNRPGPSSGVLETNGIARPTSLVAVTKKMDCPVLGSDAGVISFCESAMDSGYLLVHWLWKPTPCSATKCATADEFHLTQKSGGTNTVSTWNLELANFPKDSWKNGDCFVVRAYNKGLSLESADSYQVCVGLQLQPAPFIRLDLPTPEPSP